MEAIDHADRKYQENFNVPVEIELLELGKARTAYD